MKNFLTILKVSLIIAFIIQLINLMLFSQGDYSFESIAEQSLVTFIFSFVLTVANSYYYDGVNIRYDWEKKPKKRLWVGAIGSFVITMVVFMVLRYLMVLYYQGYSPEEFIRNERASPYIFAIIITLVVSLFIHAFYFYRALQQKQVKEQKIIAGTASAKFDALKNQLDPHFLFNSLNVLTSLIDEDQDQAQKFTASLSKVYRYVLEQKNKDLVSVDEELKFAKTYVGLLKMRFEDSIVFDIPKHSTNPDAKIIPLSLQLLLENAVKHNVVTESRPLHIRVYEENGMLVVGNNLQEKQVVKKSSGVGLYNIKQRYDILTDRTVAVEKTDSGFTVRLPILTKKVTTMNLQKEYIQDRRYEKAKEKVEAIKGFFGNLMSYCIVIPLLWYLNYRTTDFLWAIFPTLGWGFGLVMHGMEAYGYNPLFGKRWEERKIRELMEDDNF